MSEPIEDAEFGEMAALLDRIVAEHKARRGEGDAAAEPFGELAIRFRDAGLVVPGMLAAGCATAIRKGQGYDLLGLFMYAAADFEAAEPFSPN